VGFLQHRGGPRSVHRIEEVVLVEMNESFSLRLTENGC